MLHAQRRASRGNFLRCDSCAEEEISSDGVHALKKRTPMRRRGNHGEIVKPNEHFIVLFFSK